MSFCYSDDRFYNNINENLPNQAPYQDGTSSGSWTAWSDWTSCSVSCGVGVEIRFRRCRGECYGNTQLRRPCVKDTCQIGKKKVPVKCANKAWSKFYIIKHY